MDNISSTPPLPAPVPRQPSSQKSHESKKKQAKVVKTDQEKKPWTPFFYFMMQMKDKIKELPKASNEESSGRVGRIASELWSNLSLEEKEKYRVDAYNRAVELGQNLDLGYLRSIENASSKSKKGKVQKKENPEEPPGYTSSLSDDQ